ncbi:MAG TPA: ABC transporter ATP-binding protein [Candidatus Sumerlaeota bacterium]|nr:ABC transporter ATP-binding protein [Candidatus Sumerlaeota bacterium]
MDPKPVILVQDLVVEYKTVKGLLPAVDGVSFTVQPGECVGFIGPNGAGKSSTIKTLMGFIFAKSGIVEVFGEPAGTVASKRRIGYLPEVTLYYPFLKGRELLELYGGLHGLSRAQLAEQVPKVLAMVGLDGMGDRQIKNYSKGMQQRLGIAQALIAEPECLIFDELSSGLDPVGRYDLRKVLLDLKAHGVTIFFSSHELYEVEALCDRVVAIHQGRVLFDLPLAELQERATGVGLENYFMAEVRRRS